MCIRLNTVTEIRRSNACIECAAEFVYLILNRRSSEMQGTAVGKCLQAIDLYIINIYNI